MGYFIVDGHCDSILAKANHNRSLKTLSHVGHIDFPRLLQSGIGLQFMALFIETKYNPNQSLARCLELLNLLKSEMQNIEYLDLVKTKKDLDILANNRVKILVSIEGGEALDGRLEVLPYLHELGVRSLTLTWNYRNKLADGCRVQNAHGLTNFGKQVVAEMNRLGMLIDVSHLSEKGFWDVLEISKQPVIASHSCCKSLHNHPRNLSDEQLRALKNNGGVVGINYYPSFLTNVPQFADINNVVKHITHAINVIGADHIGLGSDFDGIETTPRGLEDVTKVPDLITALMNVGLASSDIEKIMGKSFVRVLKQVLPYE